MKKVRLTKNRKKALNIALSIDDVLYETYKRQQERLNLTIRDWEKKKQVIAVHKIGKQYVEKLQIIKEVKTPNGIILEVR